MRNDEAIESVRVRDRGSETTLVAGPITEPGGFAPSSRAVPSRVAPSCIALDLDPARIADLMLAGPIGSGANLITLAPALGEACELVMKRGSETLVAFELSAELGMAVAVRIAAVADVDPIGLWTSLAKDAARRVSVRAGNDVIELLVAFMVTPDGVGVEIRPLTLNGAPAASRRRSALRCCPSCGSIAISNDAVCGLDGSSFIELVERPEPGGLIGAYRLGKVLGEGGMGVVIEAEHAFLGRRAAFKLLHRTMDQDPLAGRRFLAEARLASSTRHPNIVELLDYGLLDDGRPYIVMEHLMGEALEERLERTVTIAPEAALLVAREMAFALGAAHASGVVHLDLKPSNVILLTDSRDAAPRLKIIDFGAAAPTGSSLVRELVGTPSYMSPEHARGDAVDARSDLYSLGVVLFEMISGDLPFPDGDPVEVLKAHLLEAPPAVSSPTQPLPKAVVSLVARALHKNPLERHQSSVELVADIDVALQALRRKEWLRWLP